MSGGVRIAGWVEKYGLLCPYGKCQCGCGGDAPVAKLTNMRFGHIKGEPVRYICHHQFQSVRRDNVAIPIEQQCCKCKKILPLDDFYRDARTKFGRRAECIACTRERLRANPEKTLAASRKWNSENPEYFREWRRSPKGKESMRQSRIRSHEKHRDHLRARYKVKYAVRIGRLVRLPCQFCGNQKTQAHHEDYGKPLEVIWVCRSCHIERFHSPESKVQS
jgi:hypothetical protein